VKYQEFLKSKASTIQAVGFKADHLNSSLFPFQRDIVDWALQLGKAAIFAACGNGKTAMQLAWADAVVQRTGGKVLVVAPLSVTQQTYQEGVKFGVETRVTKLGDVIDSDRIVITNYESLHKFSASEFIGVVLDESSIIKSQSSKTRAQIIEMFAKTQYKLACTATPSPNDYIELGNHAAFLGICTSQEMLATYFINDSSDTKKWNLKGHCRKLFWQWVSQWAVTIEKPSDIGYSDDGYDLPTIQYHEHVVDVVMAPDAGQLFKMEASDLMDRRRSRRNSIDERVKKCAELVNASEEQWLVWCELNDEGDALESAIDGAIQIAGKHSDDQKESRMAGFIDNTHKVLVSKCQIAGFGINLQNCHNIVFVGMSDSYEQLYQAIRRCWRFGQTEQVHVHFITASSDGAVVRNIKRKEKDMEAMIKAMIQEVSIGQDLKLKADKTTEYHVDKCSGDNWDLYKGDCVEVVAKMPDDSIDYSIYSPPFSSLFVFSDSDRDMGNVTSDEQFYDHYLYLVKEMYRVTKPGRLMSFHCMNLTTSKQNDGVIGLKDFRGDLIRICQKAGFIYHSEVCIFKDPVVAMQRTKAIGLLHKQMKKDSAMSRQGLADYLVTMRKPGANLEPIEGKLTKFVGEEGHGLSIEELEDPTERDSINIWQKYASPVWMDINQSRTLQKTSARADEDERHISPLQLDVIERCLQLWSNPGDTVLDPFNGIGSTGYAALEVGRKYIGVELKDSYYQQAKLNLELAANKKNQLSLFDL
jgi:DNA modification methylase/superfamily II DNA or RNA helicase